MCPYMNTSLEAKSHTGSGCLARHHIPRDHLFGDTIPHNLTFDLVGGITLGTSSTDYSGLLGDRLPYYGDAPDNLPVDESEASLWPMLEVVVNESEYRPGAYRLQEIFFRRTT